MMKMIKVWDIPTRLFHWVLAILFAFMIISAEADDLMQWHFYAGYVLSGLIIFRLIWGFLGTRYARFSSFIYSPARVFSYTKSLLTGQHKTHLGHTPAGGAMIFVLLFLVALQLLTGMMSTDDIIWSGPLYNQVSEEVAELAGQVHEIVQEILLVLVGLHILAIIYYKVKLKEELVPAMLHGKKPEVDGSKERENVNWVKFLLAAVPSAALTYYLFTVPI